MTGQISALVREIIDRVYPVHVILDFGAEVDPNSAIGCGTVWTRIADGRALIAADGAHPVGWTGGSASEALRPEHIAAHSHAVAYSSDGNPLPPGTGNDTFYINSPLVTKLTITEEALAYYHAYTNSTGGNQPHNNMQPSRAVCRWERTA